MPCEKMDPAQIEAKDTPITARKLPLGKMKTRDNQLYNSVGINSMSKTTRPCIIEKVHTYPLNPEKIIESRC